MPELPEVESAARHLRAATTGRAIAKASILHPALHKRITKAAVTRLKGRKIVSVERRGKHQLILLDDGSTMHVHFRMAGDWVISPAGDVAERPKQARVEFVLDDGSRIWLHDSRALATFEVHPPGDTPELGLGPEPSDRALTTASLERAVKSRRIAIKPALLDQRIVAGIGNIYAAEALWLARIDPRAAAQSLTRPQLARVLRGVRAALRTGTRRPGRYSQSMEVDRLDVYGREGEPCRRCGAAIERIVQAGRSTYFCPSCQAGD